MLAIGAAVVLGVGYGFALVSGLAEVQRIAAPHHLAGLTAVFYALAYVGFIVPALLAVASLAVSYSVLFGVLGVLALVSLGVVVRSLTTTTGAPRP